MRANVTRLGYIFFVLCSTCAYAHPLDGGWDWDAAPNSKTFSIDLNQHGNVLEGQYCAVAKNGGRIDCDDEKNLNIKGVIDRAGHSATVHFSSFFGAKDGNAKLEIQNGNLLWKITKKPSGGEFYAPMDAVLVRRQ